MHEKYTSAVDQEVKNTIKEVFADKDSDYSELEWACFNFLTEPENTVQGFRDFVSEVANEVGFDLTLVSTSLEEAIKIVTMDLELHQEVRSTLGKMLQEAIAKVTEEARPKYKLLFESGYTDDTYILDVLESAVADVVENLKNPTQNDGI